MKLSIQAKYILLLTLLIQILLPSCKSRALDETFQISIDQISSVPPVGGTYKVLVSAKDLWEVTPSDPWLKSNVSSGISRTYVTITVEPNFSTSSRHGQVKFSTETETLTLSVSQDAGDVDASKIEYDLPVVFHIFTATDEKKELEVYTPDLQKTIEEVNTLFAAKLPNPSKDGVPPALIRFKLSDTDPQGKRLQEVGIIRHSTTLKEIDYEEVLHSKGQDTYAAPRWPIERFINVYLFFFKPTTTDLTDENNLNTVVLGATPLPAVVAEHKMDGLDTYSPNFVKQYNHVLMLNKKVFDIERNRGEKASSTLAHELGHYLGLHHVFSESKTDKCADTDHCADTPSYDRKEYLILFAQILASTDKTPAQKVSDLLQRMSCDGNRFTSTNIMDYEVSYFDRFTSDQVARMRQVLYYSPMVPGQKLYQGDPATRVEVPNPSQTIRVAVCGPSLSGVHSVKAN